VRFNESAIQRLFVSQISLNSPEVSVELIGLTGEIEENWAIE